MEIRVRKDTGGCVYEFSCPACNSDFKMSALPGELVSLMDISQVMTRHFETSHKNVSIPDSMLS